MDTDSRQTGIAALSALPAVTQNGMSIEWCASLFKKWTLFVIRYSLTSQKTCIFNSPLHGQEFSHTVKIKLLVFFKPLCFLCLSWHCTCYCFWNSVMIKVSPVRRCQPHPFLLFSSSRSPASFVSTKRYTRQWHTCDELCTLFLSVLGSHSPLFCVVLKPVKKRTFSFSWRIECYGLDVTLFTGGTDVILC